MYRNVDYLHYIRSDQITRLIKLLAPDMKRGGRFTCPPPFFHQMDESFKPDKIAFFKSATHLSRGFRGFSTRYHTVYLDASDLCLFTSQ